jgi:trigger factor
MTVERNDLNECTIELKVVCTPEQIEKGFKKAIKQLGKNLRVPGFRPGTAPLGILEQNLPDREVAVQAAEEIVKDAYKQAVNDQGITPSGHPKMDLTEFNREENQLEFTALVPLRPIIEIEDYKGLKAEQPAVEITDEEIEQQLEELRKRGGQQQPVTERGIQEGDMAVVNIKLDGEEEDGRSFMIIAGQTFEALDAAISGMKAEEIKAVELTFPSTFQEKDWADTTKACHVTIRNVSGIELPEIDDDFAKKLRADSVDDLKAKIKIGLEHAKGRAATDAVNEQILGAILSTGRVIVPNTTWESVTDRRLQEMQAELAEAKSSLEEYAKEKGMTMEDLEQSLKDEAKVHVERAVVIEHIFEKEEMQITDEEVNRHFLDVAGENGIKEADLKKFADEHGAAIREEVIFRSMHSQVMQHLRDVADITEVKPS